ncbi:MAG: nucleotidyl transferase AbiEii/AbiGii toxin family protein [Bacteroidales bacterium]|nr:nucleotidyl transferase AbiEii/AbiGii toxin family protein [Bacteroidales bacterium]
MNNYIQLNDVQKQAVLIQCKNVMGLPEQAVEKDYWVTVMLQLIFDSELGEHIIFKGGTSLSKNGNLIERFSEDIDLTVNYEYFGLNDEPTKKQLKKLRKSSSLFVREALAGVITSQIERYGLKDQLTITVEPDGEGDNTYPEPRHIYVQYQSVLPTFLDYIKPMIVLEVGARSLMEPSVELKVSSIIENALPLINTDVVQTKVTTAAPQKTFLEKAFLLHELFSVEHDRLPANRRSRHLYDLNRMMDRDFAVAAVRDDALWEHIRHHRERFTSILGVDYSGDIRNRICLVPPERHIDDWRKDYQYMCDSMIYGEKPTFAELIDSMRELERRFRERR